MDCLGCNVTSDSPKLITLTFTVGLLVEMTPGIMRTSLSAITSVEGCTSPFMARYPEFAMSTSITLSLQEGMTISSLISTLQANAVSPGVQQDRVCPFSLRVKLQRSSLHWWESKISCPRIASMAKPTIITSWITGIPSKTRVISELPATSTDVPPTPDIVVWVCLKAGLLFGGILS